MMSWLFSLGLFLISHSPLRETRNWSYQRWWRAISSGSFIPKTILGTLDSASPINYQTESHHHVLSIWQIEDILDIGYFYIFSNYSPPPTNKETLIIQGIYYKVTERTRGPKGRFCLWDASRISEVDWSEKAYFFCICWWSQGQLHYR